jgi:hypothetical protein
VSRSRKSSSSATRLHILGPAHRRSVSPPRSARIDRCLQRPAGPLRRRPRWSTERTTAGPSPDEGNDGAGGPGKAARNRRTPGPIRGMSTARNRRTPGPIRGMSTARTSHGTAVAGSFELGAAPGHGGQGPGAGWLLRHGLEPGPPGADLHDGRAHVDQDPGGVFGQTPSADHQVRPHPAARPSGQEEARHVGHGGSVARFGRGPNRRGRCHPGGGSARRRLAPSARSRGRRVASAHGRDARGGPHRQRRGGRGRA